jgi:hypothetical protein
MFARFSFDYLLPDEIMFPVEGAEESEDAGPKGEYSCDQCAEYVANTDMMSFAGDCMGGPTAACCGALAPFGVEPCVHDMMDGMPMQFKPMVEDIVVQCKIILPPKCGSPPPAEVSIP